MKHKLLSILLSLAMLLSLLPTMAFADETPAWQISKENDTTTLTLTGNVNFKVSGDQGAALGGSGNLIVDLAGYTWTTEYENATNPAVTKAAFVVTAGNNITLKDSSEDETGKLVVKLTGTPEAKVQAAGVSVQQGGEFTLESGTVEATKPATCKSADAIGVLVVGKSSAEGSAASSFTMNGGEVKAEYGVRVLYEGASFTMKGGTVEGDNAVSGQGDAQGDTSIDISGGTITGKYQGIYQPQTGTLNISGGNISGWGGVEVKAGTVTISGGNITATGEKGQYSDCNEGSSSVGYAVAVVEDNDYKGGTVTIDGGTFAGGVALLNSAKEEVYNRSEVKIKAGVFDDETLYENLTGDVCKTKVAGGYTVAQAHKYDTSVTQVTKEPTCTETGVEKVFCTVCGEEGEEYTREVSALGHDYSIWMSDETQHWQKCSRCDATTAKENHLSGDTCTTCGHGCSHTGVQNYEGKAASCVTEGYEAYSVCKSCGKHVVASDPEEGGSITYTVTSDSLVTIPKLAHTYTWKSTSSRHWQECSECGYTTAELSHEYSGRVCTVCGYIKPKSSDGSSSDGSSSGGSSSGGSSGSTTYAVSVDTAKNGSVSVSSKNASKGDTVTLTVKADEGYLLKSLVVSDKDGAEMKLTDKGDGIYSFTMPGGKVTVSAVFAEDYGYERDYASCSKDATCPIETYADAVSAAWYHDGIHYCIQNGLMKGYDNGKFGTNDNISRGQIVTILWRLEGSPAVSGGSFDDVASDAYYAQAVAWAAENGIVGGYGNGKFGSNDPITREQLAAILYRYAQFKDVDVSVGEDTNILDFDDAQSISSYAVPAIQWACGSGVISGVSALTLDPQGITSRAQAATMLMHYCTEIAK